MKVVRKQTLEPKLDPSHSRTSFLEKVVCDSCRKGGWQWEQERIPRLKVLPRPPSENTKRPTNETISSTNVLKKWRGRFFTETLNIKTRLSLSIKFPKSILINLRGLTKKVWSWSSSITRRLCKSSVIFWLERTQGPLWVGWWRQRWGTTSSTISFWVSWRGLLVVRFWSWRASRVCVGGGSCRPNDFDIIEWWIYMIISGWVWGWSSPSGWYAFLPAWGPRGCPRSPWAWTCAPSQLHQPNITYDILLVQALQLLLQLLYVTFSSHQVVLYLVVLALQLFAFFAPLLPLCSHLFGLGGTAGDGGHFGGAGGGGYFFNLCLERNYPGFSLAQFGLRFVVHFDVIFEFMFGFFGFAWNLGRASLASLEFHLFNEFF